MRVLTRPDFDGIVCAVLLRDALNITTPTEWVEPNAMQHGMVEVLPGDIIANLSYHEKCTLWFDHHESNRMDKPFKGVFKIAPSAAGVIYEHYLNSNASKDKETTPGAKSFSRDFSELVRETDRIDSANLTLDEVLHPEKYPYLELSMTILSHNRDDESYWNHLVDLLQHHDIDVVLEDPIVKFHVQQAIDNNNAYINLLNTYTTVHKNTTVTDFRPLGMPPTGNRFLIFYLFPESVVNIRVRYEDEEETLVRISIGHSIFNRNCQVNAGLLCSQFGGGGHRGAGACTVQIEHSEQILATMLEVLNSNKPLSYSILYEDESLVAVEKPAGLLCAGSFCEAIEKHLHEHSKFHGNLHMVFPLERDTSGIVLLSKDKNVTDVLDKQHDTVRLFTAITEGHPEKKEDIFKSSNLDEYFPGLRISEEGKSKKYSFLKIEITHPFEEEEHIRAILAEHAVPIVGDKLYSKSGTTFYRLALHASTLAFTHPITRKRIVLESHVPKVFSKILGIKN